MDDLLHHEFTVGLPDGWKDRTELLLKGPNRNGISPTVTVLREALAAHQTLEQFSAFQLHGLKQLIGLKDFNLLHEEESKLAGLDAFKRVYNIRFQDKILTQTQVYAIRGGVAYVITATTSVDHFQEDRLVFEEIFSRFQFRIPTI